MRQLTCVITDDEPMAAEGLRRYVEKVDYLRLLGVCEDAMQLNTLLQTVHPDVIFLDIEMPYLSGLELLSTLANPPRVVITSAYEKYALKGYELHVDDYLLKPISFERFLKAVNHLRDEIVRSETIADEHKPESETKTGEKKSFFVRADKQMRRVMTDDIVAVEGLENYINIHLADGTRLTVRSTLKHITESLPVSDFLQVHRSWVVNINKVDMIEGNTISVGGQQITVARSYRTDVFERLLKDSI